VTKAVSRVNIHFGNTIRRPHPVPHEQCSRGATLAERRSHEAANLIHCTSNTVEKDSGDGVAETSHDLTTYLNIVENDSKVELYKIKEFHKHIATKGNVVERGGSFA
jgi:hypothetical protein